jgi:hypothetical protein
VVEVATRHYLPLEGAGAAELCAGPVSGDIPELLGQLRVRERDDPGSSRAQPGKWPAPRPGGVFTPSEKVIELFVVGGHSRTLAHRT